MGVRPNTLVIPDGPETPHPPASFGLGKETPLFYEVVPYPKTVSFFIIWRNQNGYSTST
jgi:hypothetical protein